MRTLNSYIQAKANLLRYFGCSDDYYINVLDKCAWRLTHDEGMSFLSYWREGAEPVSAVVVRKDGEPVVYRSNELTMVVAIDCIKIAFILKNSNELQ